MFLNIVLPFWKLLTYAYQIEILEALSLFKEDFKRQNCPSARCAAAENAIDSGNNIFNGRSVSVSMIG